MTRQILSPLLAAAALSMLPQLMGCSCNDQGVSRLGDVDENTEEDDGGHPFSTDWGQWLSATKLQEDRSAGSVRSANTGVARQCGSSTWKRARTSRQST